jgi:hypothetical protein
MLHEATTLHEGLEVPAAGEGRFVMSAAERSTAAKMVTALFDHWQLSTAQQCELLGLSPETRSTLTRYRAGQPLGPHRDLLERVGNLLGIHKSLRLLYPHNRELAYRWPTARNRALDNLAPVEVMIEHGLPGIITVRNYVDFLRGQ